MKSPARLLSILITLLAVQRGFGVDSQWVHVGSAGNLIYKTTDAGDRIMDFSFAGYEGGGVALPDVAVKKTVAPSGTDDTAAIQSALDAVAKLPFDHKFRGAVLLAPGTFICSKTITIPANGIVLRGSGAGQGGTTIKMIGARHEAIVIGKPRGANVVTSDEEISTQESTATSEFTAAHTAITDSYVPGGTNVVSVANAANFAVGDLIAIRRPTTAAWVHFMEMDTLCRDGRQQTWIGLNRAGITQRKIVAITGNQLVLDIPLADSYDAKYLDPPGATITKLRPSSIINHVGVEHLHIQCPPMEVAYGNAPYSAVRVAGDDCSARDLFCEETMNSTTLAGNRITMENVVVTHTYPNLGASKPTDFSIEGSQILIDRCKITGDNEYFVWTGSLEPGPNVILNSVFRGHGSRIQPHQRWSTGLLIDNCTVPDGGIDFMNRGVAGSGHGWTMAWAVAWNCIAKSYVIQQPPGAANWAIGCIGQRIQTARLFDTAPILAEGFFDSHGTPVYPQSLYLAQVSQRLGPDAPANIGYASDTPDDFPGKSTPPLPALSTDSDPVLGPDLALHRPINAGKVRNNSRQFAGENAVDANEKTYWATDDGSSRATLEIDTEGPLDVNAVVLEEPPGSHNVRHYKVEGQVDSGWKLLSAGTTIGDRKIDHFPNTTVWKVRLTIIQAQPYPAIRKLGLYLQP